MVSYIKLSELNIRIEHRYEKLCELCESYLFSAESEDFAIRIEQSDIEAEKEEDMFYPDSYLETVAALRKIGERLPYYNRLLCHGAAITYSGQGAFLFTAPSGTGKTTHIRLWKEVFRDRVDMINGDKPFLHIEGDHVQVYGSPWAGKEGWQKNRNDRLYGICILEQGKENKIRRFTPEECLDMLLRQTYLPKDSMAAGMTLELFEQLVRMVPVYHMTCDISEEAVKTSFETLTKLEYEKEKYNED